MAVVGFHGGRWSGLLLAPLASKGPGLARESTPRSAQKFVSGCSTSECMRVYIGTKAAMTGCVVVMTAMKIALVPMSTDRTSSESAR
jgi:hypothetical protein